MYDGHDENGPKVGKWCGNRLPREYISLSNEVLVVFRTDSSYGYDGFRLKYETSMYGIGNYWKYLAFFRQKLFTSFKNRLFSVFLSLWWKI